MKYLAAIIAVITCVSPCVSAQKSNQSAPDPASKQIASPIAPPANPTITGEPESRARDLLAAARAVFVSSSCSKIDPSRVTAAFLNHRRFHELDLRLTLDPDEADVLFEVTDAEGDTKLKYTVVDRRTSTVVASGDIFSLFGGAISHATANFLGQVRRARHIE